MTRIDPAPLPPSGSHTSLGTGAGHRMAGGMAGMMGGERIVPTTAESVLTDAAEEITFSQSDKAEEKDIDKRKLKMPSKFAHLRIKDINKLLDDIHAKREEARMKALARRLMTLSGLGARQEARNTFSDPARQYLALQYTLAGAQEENAPRDLLDSLEDAIDELMLESGPQIRAGLNTLQAAGGATTTAEDAHAMQAAYHDMVLGEDTLGDTLNRLLEQFGQDNFERGLHGMLRALGDDLSATRPSTEPTRLEALVSDLYQLEVVQTLLQRCREIDETLRREHATALPEPPAMLGGLVRLTGERWVSAPQFTRLAEEFGCHEHPPQIRLLTELKGVLREMPDKIFSDSDTRLSLMTALQDALDAAIDREEEDL